MKKKIHSHVDTEKKKQMLVEKNIPLKGQKIRTHVKKNDEINFETIPKKGIFSRKNIIYYILFLLDIILTIWIARKNVVNYVRIANQDIFVSQTKNLLFGRNYIALVITGIFYIYICFIRRFFLKEKNTKKFLIWLLVILFLLNCLLFFLFTKRVY